MSGVACVVFVCGLAAAELLESKLLTSGLFLASVLGSGPLASVSGLLASALESVLGSGLLASDLVSDLASDLAPVLSSPLSSFLSSILISTLG